MLCGSRIQAERALSLCSHTHKPLFGGQDPKVSCGHAHTADEYRLLNWLQSLLSYMGLERLAGRLGESKQGLPAPCRAPAAGSTGAPWTARRPRPPAASHRSAARSTRMRWGCGCPLRSLPRLPEAPPAGGVHRAQQESGLPGEAAEAAAAAPWLDAAGLEASQHADAAIYGCHKNCQTVTQEVWALSSIVGAIRQPWLQPQQGHRRSDYI